METSETPIGSAIVGYDGSEDSDRGLAWATERAALKRRPLVVLHPRAPYVPDDSRGVDYTYLLDTLDAPEHGLLDPAATGPRPRHLTTTSAARSVAPSGAWHVHQVLSGDYASGDLVVVGHHRTRSLSRRLQPSVATAAREHSRCPVAAVLEGARR